MTAENRQIPTEITLSREIDLSGKKAVITGASEGIGRAIALKFAYHGAYSIINSRSESTALEVLREIECLGGQGEWVGGDINEKDTRDRLVAVAKSLGGADILVNNVGTTADNVIPRMTDEQVDKVLDLNLRNTIKLSNAMLKDMFRKDRSYLINISSVSAAGNAGQANYAASKAGLEFYGNSVAEELGPRGVRVVNIEVGLVEGTNLTKDLTPKQLERYIEASSTKTSVKAEEIADFAAYFASGRLDSMTRLTVPIDNGMRK